MGCHFGGLSNRSVSISVLLASLPNHKDGHFGELSDLANGRGYSPFKYLSQNALLASEKCFP